MVNETTRDEIQTLALHNPEPANVVVGRLILYDANLTSSNGEASCSGWRSTNACWRPRNCVSTLKIPDTPAPENCCATRRCSRCTASRKVEVTELAAGFAFSLSIEMVQALIPGRDSSLIDLTSNSVGALVGASLSRIGSLR